MSQFSLAAWEIGNRNYLLSTLPFFNKQEFRLQGESQWTFEREKVRSTIKDSKIFLLSFVMACLGRISSVHMVFFAQVPKS